MKLFLLRVFIVTAVVSASMGVATLYAQAGVTQYASEPQARLLVKEPQEPNRNISVVLENAPLSSVFDSIAKQAGLRIVYNASDPVLRQRVSRSILSKSIEGALRQATGSATVSAELTPDGETILLRARSHAVDGVIVGKVVNAKSQQPVAGATVTLEDDTRTVTTGADGTFRMPVGAGEYRITVKALGLVRQQKTVQVDDGQTVTVEFAMDESASVLSEVVVTGTVVATERKAIPTPITVIKAEDIERRGITRIDQLFRGEVPGVLALEVGSLSYSVEQYGSQADNFVGVGMSQIYTRGSSSLDASANPIKTYVDGVELLDPSYLGTIDPRSIERIEIVTGPQAATIYGSGALGGVMQIFTKRGTGSGTPEFRLSLKYGMLENSLSNGKTPSHNDVLSVTGGAGPAFSYSANLSYDYVGQWQPDLFSRRYGVALGATHRSGPVTIAGSLSLTNGSNGTVNGTSTSSGSPLKQELVRSGIWQGQNGNGTAGIMSLLGRVSYRSSQTMSLNVDYQPLSVWQHHLTIGRSQNEFKLKPYAPAFLSESDTMYSYTNTSGRRLSMSYNTTWTPTLPGLSSTSLTFGVTGTLGDNAYYAGSAPNPSASSYESPRVRVLLDDENWGGFGSWRFGFFDQLYLTLGLRAERNPSYGESHRVDWTPTNGVAYTVEHGDWSVKFLASYGRATRPGTMDQTAKKWSSFSSFYEPNQYVNQIAAPNLTPEYEQGPQGGVEIYYGNLGQLTINHYSQKVKGLIQRVIVDSVGRTYNGGSYIYWGYVYQNQNIASVKKHGWEATSVLTLGMVTLKGTYSWNDSRVQSVGPSYFGGLYPGASFLRIPSHTASLNVGYALRNTSINLVTNFIGAKPIDSNNLPALLVWDHYMRLRMYIDRMGSFSGSYRMAGYYKSDLAVQHRIAPWATLTLNVTNLGNSFASDAWNSMQPSFGRQTLIGLSLRSR